MIRDSQGRATIIDLTGQRFDKLLVLRLVDLVNHKSRWECSCSCGNLRVVLSDMLRQGRVKSCGCNKGRNLLVHGETGTPEFRSWAALKSRCYNPNNNRYYRYGARGIKVCDRWLGPNGFINFLADMGKKPTPDHSIDRFPNNDGNYEPGNCRWATRVEQWDNRRKAPNGVQQGRGENNLSCQGN